MYVASECDIGHMSCGARYMIDAQGRMEDGDGGHHLVM